MGVATIWRIQEGISMNEYNPNKSIWYNSNIEYLINHDIYEYDMKDAGLSIIQHYNLLSSNEINKLLELNKDEQHIAIGLLQRKDTNLSKTLSEKFIEMRSLFISANNISDDSIISVKKDAIYTIGPYSNLTFGCIKFVPKNHYSSYIRFVDNMNIEIYYGDGLLTVKGIGENALNHHRLYNLVFLKEIISDLEEKNISIKRYLKKFIDDYKTNYLDREYYLEFNNMSNKEDPLFNYQKLLIPIIQITLRELE
jgi:hypothetical protein